MKDYFSTLIDIIRHESPRLLKQYLISNPNWTLMEKGLANTTPLIEAVSIERIDIVAVICDYVQSKNNSQTFVNYLNQTSSDGKSAILVATCMNHKPEIIEYLVSHGANFDLKDNSGKSVFDYAIFSPSEEIELFWQNFDPKKYQEIIKLNIDNNSTRQRAGSRGGYSLF